MEIDQNTGAAAARTVREMHLEREKMWNASIANHARYIDPATGAIASRFVEERACPACGSTQSRFMFKKSGGFYHTCIECRMVFLNPALTDAELVDYYRNNHSVQGEVVAEDIAFYRELYLKGLDAIGRFLPGKGRILDVGCSTGIFLDLAMAQGWETHGLELNRSEIEIARQKNHAITEGTIETADFAAPFDAVSLWDVFEHIKDGHRFLTDAKRVLRKGGVVFIQTPSRDALAARVMQAACNMFDGLEHVNLYGRQSLEIVARRNGYEVVGFETVIAEIGVMNNYLDYDHPYLGGSRDMARFAGVLTADQIHAHGLGYKFQACLMLGE